MSMYKKSSHELFDQESGLNPYISGGSDYPPMAGDFGNDVETNFLIHSNISHEKDPPIPDEPTVLETITEAIRDAFSVVNDGIDFLFGYVSQARSDAHLASLKAKIKINENNRRKREADARLASYAKRNRIELSYELPADRNRPSVETISRDRRLDRVGGYNLQNNLEKMYEEIDYKILDEAISIVREEDNNR